MENLEERTQKDAQTRCSGADRHNANTVSGSEGDLDQHTDAPALRT